MSNLANCIGKLEGAGVNHLFVFYPFFIHGHVTLHFAMLAGQ